MDDYLRGWLVPDDTGINSLASVMGASMDDHLRGRVAPSLSSMDGHETADG